MLLHMYIQITLYKHSITEHDHDRKLDCIFFKSTFKLALNYGILTKWFIKTLARDLIEN